MLRGGWRKWKESSPHVLGTVSKHKLPSPHNVRSPLSAPSRRWVFRPRSIGGRPRQTRTTAFEEVLERVSNDPSTSTRAIAHAMGSNQYLMLRVLQEQSLHAHHLQKVQGLGPNDFVPRVRINVNPAFPAQVLFTDEACFTRDGYFKSRNSHIWDDENPHAVFIRVYQTTFKVNIWGGILGDYLLGPVIIPDRLNGAACLEFLQNTLRCSWRRYTLRYAEKFGSNKMPLQHT